MPDLLLLPLFAAAALVLAGLRHVPEGQVHTVHRFGRYVRALTPGWHWVLPGLDRIAHQVLLIGHHVELPPRRLGDAAARADLYYQILDPVQAGDSLDQVDAVVLAQADAALAELATPPQGGLAAAAEALKAELNRRIGRLGLRVIRCALYPSA